MSFFRSFRRRLSFLFVVAIGCLLAISLPGVVGFFWHLQAVDDLDFLLNRSPDENRLSRSVIRIGEVLHSPLEMNHSPPAHQLEREFLDQIRNARKELLEFRKRTESLPQGNRRNLNQRQMATRRLERIDVELGSLWKLGEEIDQNSPEFPRKSMSDIRYQTGVITARIQRTIETLPTTQTRDWMALSLNRVRGQSASLLSFIIVMSVFVGLALIVWLVASLRWISGPVRKLADGCTRIANGDTSFRLEQMSRWQDELADVVDGVNNVADRYQQSEEDLQQKVRERSDQLIRSQRMANVGFLAAGVAHEINNPLQAIIMAADIIERLVRALEELPDAKLENILDRVAMVRKESSRCGDITRRLLDFSRADHGVRTWCNLVDLVDEVTDVVGHLGQFSDRQLIFQPTGPVSAEVSAEQIKQVILNLTANALQAVPPGGTVEISLIEQVDFIVLTVTDNGCGMSEDTLEHVFDPFYSERQTGQGTGLGLSIIHRIIEDHDGTITPSSDGPDQGSTFAVRLPRRSRHCSAA